jgi:hypothetical protein
MVGVVNASVWVGAAVFFTFFAGPSFFSEEMKAFLPPPYNGAAAQVVIGRFFLLQNCCGALALVHLTTEWLYTGRPFNRILLWVLSVMFALSLLGSLALLPHMKKLHLIKYDTKSSQQEREEAAKSFGRWHGASQIGNLLVLGGVFFYLWQVTKPGALPVYGAWNKFRS